MSNWKNGKLRAVEHIWIIGFCNLSNEIRSHLLIRLKQSLLQIRKMKYDLKGFIKSHF